MVSVAPEPGPIISGFAAWLDGGRTPVGSVAGHLGAAREFLTWYGVNGRDDLVGAAREFGTCGSAEQAASMRLLVGFFADEPGAGR